LGLKISGPVRTRGRTTDSTRVIAFVMRHSAMFRHIDDKEFERDLTLPREEIVSMTINYTLTSGIV
jgi:hypothetical protein